LGLSQRLEGWGYYGLIRKDSIQLARNQGTSREVSRNGQLDKLRAEYEKFKKTLPSPSDRKDINSIGADNRIKLDQLRATEEEKRIWNR
jgi:hypothetical protein